jgi:hypothetical protein
MNYFLNDKSLRKISQYVNTKIKTPAILSGPGFEPLVTVNLFLVIMHRKSLNSPPTCGLGVSSYL